MQEKLIKDLYSDDWELCLEASDQLSKIKNKNVISKLLQAVRSNNNNAVNAAALALREMKEDSVVDSLIEIINFKLNEDCKNISTIVYALEELNCKKHFLDIFKLTFSKKWDISCSALNILSEQSFIINNNCLRSAEAFLLKNASQINKERLDFLLSYLREVQSFFYD